MKSAGLSEREKLMLPTAFVVIALVLYGAFRWKPANAAIVELQKELTTAIQGREKLKFPNAQNQSPEQLEQQLIELTSELETTQTALAAAHEALVDITKEDELQHLKIQISTLAQESRVTIVESVPDDDGANRKTSLVNDLVSGLVTLDSSDKRSAPVSHELFQHLYERPWQRIAVKASFTGLLTFARGLKALDWQVTLVGFAIKTEGDTADVGPPQLAATFILAL